MQRARGAASVVLGAGGLRDLSQSGSAKAMLPRTHGVPEVVFLNTAGGITSGDRLSYALEVGAGAEVVAATQTAERGYRATDGPGRLDVRLSVGAGARLDWLPQETILFEGADLRRRTEVDLAADADLLMVESVVLGRAAMGEAVARARLDDRRRVARGGPPLHDDHLALDAATLADPAALGDSAALASLVLAAPNAADAVGPLRRLLDSQAVRAACGAWDGRLVLRLAASAAQPLRRALVSAIVTLRGRPVPRVWQDDA
ncbi:urease accessory protein UreD [Jannaschia sp. Os4]|uniref:urease accessory protein UreD n=1 Tax=Jannaschia sp. Os4 TaxID=2807617 RepID=UPI001EED7714|nr:urease accessory protein UreD [Jannaschia sp. Os4]